MTASRVGIYARVSTTDQNTENQLVDMRHYAVQRGWTIFREYVDHGISGSKDSRPALDSMMGDARKRRLDIVLVTKFDRFARSAKHLLNALDEFRSLGIDFCSVQDSCDTTTPYGRVLFTIIAAMAELERSLIRERVCNGVQKAREKGKKLGRPRLVLDIDRIRSLSKEGHSRNAIARITGVSRMTVGRVLLSLAQNPPQKSDQVTVEN